MSNSNVPEHATRTRRVTGDLLHAPKRAAVKVDEEQKAAVFVAPVKRAPAPKTPMVRILDPKTLDAERNVRDLSEAITLTDREVAERAKQAKIRQKEAKAAERAKAHPAGPTSAASLPSYRVQLTDGTVSNPLTVDPKSMDLLAAIKLHAAELADRAANFRANVGYFLVVYRTIQDGPQRLETVEIRFYEKAGWAHRAGDQARAEGADRFSVSQRIERSTLLQAERSPSRDPFKRVPNVWLNRQHKQTWGFGESRAKQSRCHFSHG